MGYLCRRVRQEFRVRARRDCQESADILRTGQRSCQDSESAPAQEQGRQHRCQRPSLTGQEHERAGSGIESTDAGLHILERHIGVHGCRDRGAAMPKLLLHLPQIAGFSEQVHGQGVTGAVD